jgi:6-phosphogluconolactonase (cycloisomerase 2 family)/uncharacterized protein YjdB
MLSKFRSRLRTTLFLAVVLLVAAGVSSCGGSDGTVSLRDGAGAATATTGSVVVINDLAAPQASEARAQSVPAGAVDFVYSGFDAGGNRLYGPLSFPAAQQQLLTEVPLEVTRIHVDYNDANGQTLAGADGLVDVVAAETVVVIVVVDGEVEITGLSVTPVSPLLAPGTTLPLTATATFSDGRTQVLTDQVEWESGNPAVATVDDEGLLSAVSPGQSTITATLNVGGAIISASTVVSVSHAVLTSLSVSPANAEVAQGVTQRFTATGVFSDGSTQDLTSLASWSSSDTAGATVSSSAGSKGLATGVSATSDPVTITATALGVSGTARLSVSSATLTSVEIDPDSPTVPVGLARQLTAIATFSDDSQLTLTDSADWTSATPAVATVSSRGGLLTGVSSGTSAITVSLTVDGVTRTDTTTATVSNVTLSSLQVAPATATVAKGQTQQFTATGFFSDGSSLDLTSAASWAPTVGDVSVSNTAGSRGLARANAVTASPLTVTASVLGKSGTATMSVTAATLASLKITPVNPAVPRTSGPLQMEATATFSDNAQSPVASATTWTSTNEDVAGISANGGLLTPLAPGTTTINASYTVGGVTRLDSTTVTVTTATLESIAVSSSAGGPFINGTSRQYIAIGTFSDTTEVDLTSAASWAPISGAVSLSNLPGSKGLASANSATASPVTITATAFGVSGETTVMVSEATLSSLEITPDNPTIPLAAGVTFPLTATASYTGGPATDETANSTWSVTGATGIASVDPATGVVTPLAAGTTTITASRTIAGVEKNDSTTVTVSPATLESLVVEPAPSSIARGLTQQYVATGTFSDNSQVDLTSAATWTASGGAPAGAVTISTLAGSKGLATGVNETTTPFTITATFSGQSDTATLAVSAATLSSVKVTPEAPSIASGGMQQFAVTATFSDGTTSVQTGAADWSSDGAAVSITNPGGLATGMAVGQANVSASLTIDGVTRVDGTLVTVTAAELTGLAMEIDTLGGSNGSQVTFKAIGTFSDGTTQDVSATATWSSLSTSVATSSGSGVFSVLGTPGQLASVRAARDGLTANGVVLVMTKVVLAGTNDLLIYQVIDPDTGALSTTPTTVPSPGGASTVGLDRLTMDPSGLRAYALTNSSTILTIPLQSGGTAGTITSSGPTTLPATSNAGSSIKVTPNGKFLYATNGDDKIYQFSVDSAGAVTALSPASVASGLAVANRLDIDPTGGFLYVGGSDDAAGEGNRPVAAFAVGADGTLSALAGSPIASAFVGGILSTVTVSPDGASLYAALTASTVGSVLGTTLDLVTGLPADLGAFTGGGNVLYFASAITPDGSFFFASGDNNSTAPTVPSGGTQIYSPGLIESYVPGVPPSGRQTFSSNGTRPYDLAMDPSGKFLVVVNRATASPPGDYGEATDFIYRTSTFAIDAVGTLTNTSNVELIKVKPFIGTTPVTPGPFKSATISR